jgi:hypothetical protein
MQWCGSTSVRAIFSGVGSEGAVVLLYPAKRMCKSQYTIWESTTAFSRLIIRNRGKALAFS